MTAGTPTGALSPQPVAWHTIDWYAVHRTVRRLQARMVKVVSQHVFDVASPRSARGVGKA